jgi:hypothetical protein
MTSKWTNRHHFGPERGQTGHASAASVDAGWRVDASPPKGGEPWWSGRGGREVGA